MIARLFLAAAAFLVPVAPAAAEAVPDGYTYEHAWFESHDGTQMHAGVFLPADRAEGERHPVLMTITPYTAPNGGATAAGNMEGPVIRFPELFSGAKILEDRWAYVQIDVRGFGGSGGCFEYYGPNEFLDARAAVEWGADQAWSTGRVGLVGKSYDAAQQVLALGARPRGLAAAVIQAPGLSAYTALWMNRIHYATGRYGTTGVYTADDVGPVQNPETATSTEYALATVSGLTAPPTCRADALVGMNVQRDREAPFWAQREPYKLAKGAETPVLWSHGFFDANTKPEHLPIWTTLRGPRQGWFGQYTHLRGHEPGVGRRGFLEESMRFLDRHVRGVAGPGMDPPVTVQEGNGAGAWRAEAAWPPADARPWSMPIRAGEYTDAPGNDGDGSGAGNGHWTLSRPLPHAAHMAGQAAVRVELDTVVPNVNVVAHLYDVDPDGEARLVQRGALAPATSGPQTVEFALYPQDWRFEAGHRIGLLLSGADDSWFTPGVSQTPVAVARGELELPLLRYVRDAWLEGGPSDAIQDASPFAVAEDALAEAGVEHAPPPPMEPRPPEPTAPVDVRPPSPPASTPPAVVRTRRGRATLRLRRSGRRVIVRGRAPGARFVRLLVRFGGVRLASRSVRVRGGRYRATFPIRRLRRGRLVVVARIPGGRPLRAGLRIRPRR